MTVETGQFVVASLLERIVGLPSTSRFWVGFSGGADSTALLVALKELGQDLPGELHAVHFNHGLQDAALDWQTHCQSFCDQRGIPLLVRQLDLSVKDGRSLEEHARHQRYLAIERLLEDGEIYLTAHQADDNAETLFLHLMRGSGMDGLAAIPHQRTLGKGLVARPLLDFRRCALEEYLHNRGIEWLQDPSNLDQSFDRNFIRNRILPEIEKRWPGAVARINQTAWHARDLTNALNQLLLQQHGKLLIDNFTLALEPLLQLEPGLQAMLLRRWIRDQEIITPPRLRLNEFLNQLNTSVTRGNQAELRWSDYLLKRHGALLWLHSLPCPGSCPTRSWITGTSIDLNAELGQMSLCGNPVSIPDGWEIGARRRGAKMQVHSGGPRRKLKELMRERGIPPWLRDTVPVLYWHEEVAAVGDFLVSPELRRFLLEQGTTYHWKPHHPLLRKLQSVSVDFLERVD